MVSPDQVCYYRKQIWFSSNIKETPSCVCRQYCWENFQANQTSSRSHALLMVSPQTNSSDIKDKYWADINIYVEPIWYIETSNTWNNAIMEHTNVCRFWDGNPRSDKSKDIFCDNWIQGWISLVWEKQNCKMVLFPQKPCHHQTAKNCHKF